MTPERRAHYQAVRRAAYERQLADAELNAKALERGRDYDANRRQRDPELARKYAADRKARNPEKVREQGRRANAKHYSNNADEQRAKRRAYSQTPEAKEKAKLYARKWRAANPDKSRRRSWKQRGESTKDETRYALILLNDPCVYCGGKATEIDHIVPIAAGGQTTWDNLAPACSFCNRSKRDRSLLTHLLRVKTAA